ncbi:MAG: hypothetical protein ACOCZJ_02600 [Thermoplasmatota archaeon]
MYMKFLMVILLTLGLGLFLSGLFTAYFGRGKSRMVGVALTIIGILFWVITYVMDMQDILFGSSFDFMGTLTTAITYVGAFVIGAIIAVGIFLVAIMKT